MLGSRSAIVDGVRPRDQVAMRHHHARHIDRQISVAELIKVQHVGP